MSGTAKAKAAPGRPLSLRHADAAGLTAGPKSRHINAKVPPALFDAAAEKIGDTSPSAVVTAALAALAMQDGVGPWLAANWGILADVPEEIWEQIRF